MKQVLRIMNALHWLTLPAFFLALFNSHRGQPHETFWTIVGVTSWIYGRYGGYWMEKLRNRYEKRDLSFESLVR